MGLNAESVLIHVLDAYVGTSELREDTIREDTKHTSEFRDRC
jgi:hypothetical protein